MESQVLNLNRQLSVFGISVRINRLYSYAQRQGDFGSVHSYMVLYYNTEGSCVLKLEYNRSVVVDKGQWVLLDRNLIHEEVVYGRCSGFCLGIEVEPEQTVKLFPGLFVEGWCCTQGGDPVGWLLERIWQENCSRVPGYGDYSDHLLSLLVMELSRACKGSLTPKPAPREQNGYTDSARFVIDTFFNRVFRYERDGLTVDALAQSLHMSTRNVNRILKKYYGMTFQQMLLLTRLRFAEYLLLQSDRSIREICELCDLSEAYMIRCFRQIHGVTPAQFRREHR